CFRVGHLGMIEERDAFSILGTVELALAEHGVLDAVGRAVPAAQAVLRPAATGRAAAGAPA
ncbi:MAG TPA: serine--glyoxylate aminotransferase, partial [Candidatus Dormibacteraeota bacterium]|nr:serine--glyoxylate aminotransferase [Candidatus Dormibacteraeota bacterium]